MIINLKFLNGNTKEVEVEPEKTIRDIKVEHLDLTNENLDDIKIIYAGKILNNDDKIDNLALSDKSFFVILTTSKTRLESISNKNDSDSIESDQESLNGDLFTLSDDDVEVIKPEDQEKEQEKEPEINYQEVIDNNNKRFLELYHDPEFKTLINIVLNKPDYLNYALKFVQSGMIFNRPNSTDQHSNQDYNSQLEVLESLNLTSDQEKLKKALTISMGDIQIAIRYIYQSQFDENFSL